MQDPTHASIWDEYDDHATPEAAEQSRRDSAPIHYSHTSDEPVQNALQQPYNISSSVDDEERDRVPWSEYESTTNEPILPGDGAASTTVGPAQAANGHPTAPPRRAPTAPIDRQNREAASPIPALKRVLHEIHIFMIATGAVIGMGFYVRTGTIYHFGGSAAVLYSFAFLGLVTSLVMHNLAKMLSAWPVAGALTIFVEKFVDEEVGMIIGILYWLTYIFSFAGLTTTLGRLADSVLLNSEGEVITSASVIISIISLLLPILFNLTPPKFFRHIELAFGVFKLILAICVILIMNILNPHVGAFQQNLDTVRRNVAFINTNAFGDWAGVFFTSIYLTSFGYVGVEAVAATSREAKLREDTGPTAPAPEVDGYEMNNLTPGLLTGNTRPPTSDPYATSSVDAAPGPARHATHSAGAPGPGPHYQARRTYRTGDIFRRPAMLVPLVATFIYIWGGWSVMQNVDSSDPNLPSLVWGGPGGTSIFVEVANNDHNEGLSKSLTALLIVNLFSTSSTALYIASRTLYGMAYTSLKKRRSKTAGWLTKTTKHGVPWISVLVSAWLFWLPFIRYGPRTNVNIAIDVIVEMGSVSCILVWGFESLAAFRLYGAYSKHYTTSVRLSGVGRDFVIKANQTAWYRFHRVTSLFAAFCCFLIVVLGGVMICGNNNQSPLQGIAAFLVIGIFFAGIVVLKWRRGKFARPFSKAAFLPASLDANQFVEVLKTLDTHA